MKVETPQILWNSEGDKGINAALLSLSMIQSGLSEYSTTAAAAAEADSSSNNNHVLATAGNTECINLWRIAFHDNSNKSQSPTSASNSPSKDGGPSTVPSSLSSSTKNFLFHRPSPKLQTAKMEYLCTLARHDGPVNAVAFSPDGLHLASAGDTGSIIVWSVPVHLRGNNNGRHFWSSCCTREQDLTVQIISTGEAICDLSWSADSKRFMVGSIDHSVMVIEDLNFDINHNVAASSIPTSADNVTPPPVQPQQQVDSKWKVVYRNALDHTHYVQGVSFDPLGVYLASMSSDRSVRVYPRKAPSRHKKKVLRPANSSTSLFPPPDHAAAVDLILTDAKLEITKSKLLKYRTRNVNSSANPASTVNISTLSTANSTVNAVAEVGTASTTNPELNLTKTKRQHLFADEATLRSFVRRLAWTTDGAYLVTPAAVWQQDDIVDGISPAKGDTPQYATCLFARHKWDEPCRVLIGLEKPSIAVRSNPILFKLPKTASSAVEEDCKENKTPSSTRVARPQTSSSTAGTLPYRSIFAVLTWDSVILYDTYHSQPISIVRGLHYCNIVDAEWSADGHTLLVCSTDGYISILQFDKGELGEVYTPPVAVPANTTTASPIATTAAKQVTPPTSKVPNGSGHSIPPCEAGSAAVLEAPPAKRIKTQEQTPFTETSSSNNNGTLSGSVESNSPRPETTCKRSAADAQDVGQGVDKMSLTETKPSINLLQPKKKKRVQLVSVPATN